MVICEQKKLLTRLSTNPSTIYQHHVDNFNFRTNIDISEFLRKFVVWSK